MDISSGDISALVLKRVVREDTAEYSFDAQMLTLFMELDGKKSLAAISKKTGLKMSTMREAASKLLKLKLIEQAAEAIAAVDAGLHGNPEERAVPGHRSSGPNPD